MRQPPEAEMERGAREYTRWLSLVGALIALVQVFIGAAAARENQTIVLTVQRTLINLASGGGSTPILALQLLPMFVVTYLAGGVTFLLTLLLCWQTGRLITLFSGSRRKGSAAGRHVALVTSAIWLVAVSIVSVAFQGDGSFSWLLATIGALIVTPASHLRSDAGILITAPGATFLAFQAVILLVFDIPATLIAFGLSALASGIGARSAPEWNIPQQTVEN